MKKIIFATNNLHKLSEVQAMVEGKYKLYTPKDFSILEEIPEDKPTLEGNSMQKARYIYDRTLENCFADDTGLEVEALGSEPGVLSARYAGETKDSNDNINLLLKNLEGISNRKARFRTVITLILDSKEYQFEGEVTGTIIDNRIGVDGFGYDPIFIPDGYTQTFAEMEAAEKNKISHRGRAVAKLIDFLNQK